MSLLKIKRKGEPKQEASGVPVEKFEVLPQDQLGISEAARNRILELKKSAGEIYLRVAIRGGGCSGLSLHYEITDHITDRDIVFTNKEAKVVIDKKSLSILGGATLHCRDYLSSKEFFLVNNPAEKQCSCGKSFSI